MKREFVSDIDQRNKKLHIKLGAEFWMDKKYTRDEKTHPIKVTVKEIYPYVIIVEDKDGKKTGIPAASAALELRKTKRRKILKHQKESAPKRPPLDREKIIKGHLAGKSGRQIAKEIGWSDVSVNRIIREWKQKQGA